MTLDQLCASIASSSCDPVAIGLVQRLHGWKFDSASADDLLASVEKYLGNVWIQSDAEYSAIYKAWSEFRDEVGAQLRGMTMNERLYLFGLVGAFDAATSVAETDRIYAKLHASR